MYPWHDMTVCTSQSPVDSGSSRPPEGRAPLPHQQPVAVPRGGRRSGGGCALWVGVPLTIYARIRPATLSAGSRVTEGMGGEDPCGRRSFVVSASGGSRVAKQLICMPSQRPATCTPLSPDRWPDFFDFPKISENIARGAVSRLVRAPRFTKS